MSLTARLFYFLNLLILVLSACALGFFVRYDMQTTVVVFVLFICLLLPLLPFFSLSHFQINRRFARINLLAIAVISTVTLIEVMNILGEDRQFHLVRVTPLLICTLGLYFAYWFVSYFSGQPANPDRPDQLVNHVFTGPSVILCLLMAVPVTVFILLLLMNTEQAMLAVLATKFTERGIIPPLTLWVFLWSLLLLTNKYLLLITERRAFFSRRNDSCVYQAYCLLEREKSFDRQSLMSYFSDLIRTASSDFYTLPRYINWAIPVLGFIGTVLGISLAADGIQRIISQQNNSVDMIQHLGEAVSPLGIAFDTTLIALSLSVLLVLLQTALQRFESSLLMTFEDVLRQPSNKV